MLGQPPGGGVARLNADGRLDATFNVGSGASDFNGSPALKTAVAVLPNGQILIGAYNGVASGSVARLNADGTLDPTFHVGQGADGNVDALSVQADGRVLAAGDFDTFDGASIDPKPVRLNTDGSLDTGYIPDLPGVIIFEVAALLVQGNGRVLITGSFNNAGLVGSAAGGVLRLNADGTLDTSFDGGNGVLRGLALALQPDGKALVAFDQSGVDNPLGPGDVLRVYDVLATSPAPTTPTVTIAAGAKKVYESGGRGPATFIVSLSSAPTSKLIIHYALKGSAINGFDYQPVSGKVKIKPGHTSATISVYPYDEGINDGSVVTLKAVLLPGTSYTVSSPGAAEDKITDDK